MADDDAAIRTALEGLGAPAVLVGHSYAGVPVTEASAGLSVVKHLVYVCAILPDEDQSTGSLMAEDPNPSALGEAIVGTGDGLSTLDQGRPGLTTGRGWRGCAAPAHGCEDGRVHEHGGSTMAVCAHKVCTCEAKKGERFCSEFCEKNPKAPECHCHHDSCDAPHHH